MTAAFCDATNTQRLAMACATLESDGTVTETQGYGDAYGWFWVGGVCPAKEITILDDDTGAYQGHDVTTDGVTQGPVFFDMSGDRPMFKPGEVTLLDVTKIDGIYMRSPFAYADISER